MPGLDIEISVPRGDLISINRNSPCMSDERIVSDEGVRVMSTAEFRAADRAAASNRISFVCLAPFLFIAFAIAWTILGLYIYRPDQITPLFGSISGSHPLFVLSVYSPAIAAISLVALRTGSAGLMRYFSRLALWRCPCPWYVFLLFGIPAIYCAGAWVKGDLFQYQWPFNSIGALAGALAFMLFLGPVEEFGWRGFAFPLLQQRMAPIWASLILGAIWGLWHLPAFLLAGTPQSAWSFTPFFLGAIALSVIVAPLFNSSTGSILLPALFHFQLNNPIWPDAQPYDTIFFVLAAVIVLALNWNNMVRQGAAVTEVVPRPANSA